MTGERKRKISKEAALLTFSAPLLTSLYDSGEIKIVETGNGGYEFAYTDDPREEKPLSVDIELNHDRFPSKQGQAITLLWRSKGLGGRRF